MSRPTLTAPFANVETIEKGGCKLTYVPAAELVDRLNTVLGTGKWSFSVTAWRDEADPDWVIAQGRLTVHATNDAGIGATEIWQYGGQQVNRKRPKDGQKVGDLIDLGDDFKGASSDALKKCAQHIGVGLYLSLGHSPLSAREFSEAGRQEGGANEASGDTTSTSTSSGTGGGAGERASASTIPGGEPF